MMTSVKTEKVLYLAIIPFFYLSGGGEGKKAKKITKFVHLQP